MWRVLAVDRFAFWIPEVLPLALFWGGTLIPAKPPSPWGSSASRQRFPGAVVDVFVVVAFDAT